MKRIKKVILPMAVLIVFVALMTTGGILKRPMDESDDVMGHVKNIKIDVSEDQWQQAEIDYKKAQFAWKKILFRIQFSTEQERLYNFEAALALLKGAIVAKDSNNSIIAIESLTVFWEQIGG